MSGRCESTCVVRCDGRLDHDGPHRTLGQNWIDGGVVQNNRVCPIGKCTLTENHFGPCTDSAEEANRALVELAQAASLVVAEWESDKNGWDKLAILDDDIKRLKARLVEHMPAIEAAQTGAKT